MEKERSRTGERSSSCPKRKPSSRQIENEALKEIIKTIFYEHKERYRRGIRGNRKRIARLLHELCLYAKGNAINISTITVGVPH